MYTGSSACRRCFSGFPCSKKFLREILQSSKFSHMKVNCFRASTFLLRLGGKTSRPPRQNSRTPLPHLAPRNTQAFNNNRCTDHKIAKLCCNINAISLQQLFLYGVPHAQNLIKFCLGILWGFQATPRGGTGLDFCSPIFFFNFQ